MKNFVELSEQEQEELNGGWIGIVVAIGLYVLSEWDDISAGFNDGVGGEEYNYDPC